MQVRFLPKHRNISNIFLHIDSSIIISIVGYFNYRYFVTFLIYVFVGMSYGAMIMLEPFMNLNGDLYRKQLSLQRRAAKEGLTLPERIQPMIPFREEKMTLSLSFMICVAVGIAILIIGGFHIYLACTAQTTIEFHANWNSRRRARAMGQKWKNPYCKGSWKANWQQIFGGRPLLFSILPSSREPEYLPVPVPGHNGLRSEIQKKINADELEESETREAGNVV
jgi:palmitoyltransferase